MDRFIAFDLEFQDNLDLHHAHKRIDKKSSRKAVAIKTITAAACLEYTVGSFDDVSVDGVTSWTIHDWQDEASLVEQICSFIASREKAVVLTWGGVATDLPVLTLAAMRAGVELPRQLREGVGRRHRMHQDVGLLLKGSGKTWSHLSQVCLRIGMPHELIAEKPEPIRPNSSNSWMRLRNHVEADTLLLALAHHAWFATQGMIDISYRTAAIAHISAFLELRPDHRLHHALAGYRDRLVSELGNEPRGAA